MPPLAPRAWSTGTGLHSTRACSELSTPFQTATFTASRMLSNSTRLAFAGWLSDLPPIQALCTLTYVGARTSRRLHLVMQGRISVQKYLSIFTLHDVTAKLTALSKSCWICIYSITNGSVELRMLHCGVVAGTKPTLHLSLVEYRIRYSAVSAVLVNCPSPPCELVIAGFSIICIDS